MFLFTVSLTTALVGVGSASPTSLAKRTEDLGSLYVYGENIIGLPIFYSNGAALIGNGVPSKYAARSANVTFTIDSEEHAIVQPADSSEISTQALYINTSDRAYEPVFFVPQNSTSATNGFFLYGRSLFLEVDGQLEGHWYAVVDTGEPHFYRLAWNSPNTNPNTTSVPVVIKNIAPLNNTDS